MIHGIDVASYQSSTPDYSGQDFVVVKATEGTSYVNAKHAAQVAAARKAGLVVGHYHFVKGDGMDAQADYFLTHAAPQADEILVLDWESPDVTDGEKNEFIRHLKTKAGPRKVGLYCNTDYWTHREHSDFAGDFLWIADPNHPAGHPDVTHPWTIHQYSSAGGSDRDVAQFASREAMAEWAGKPAPKPTPAPSKTPPAKTTKPPAPKPAAKPVVDLSNLVSAARRDPHLHQGGTTHPADVRVVEAALRAEGLLSAMYFHDGSFGTATRAAYANWQRRCGVAGPYDGIPGIESLRRLGAKHGFTVKA
jgi:hypothetical protein